MSRVTQSADRARERQENGHDLSGASLASDAFFPFPDGPALALEAGVTALIQPGGSRRDPEVIEAVASTDGATMVFTGRRALPPLAVPASGGSPVCNDRRMATGAAHRIGRDDVVGRSRGT